jgi:formate hydrogenlyase subunit 3/multisubunit Na+/H+ antiporter MnhD subunit
MFMVARRFCHRSDAMKLNPFITLKWGAAVAAVFWIGWMLWWSESFEPANIVILATCGAAFGFAWYYAMRFVFRHMFRLTSDGRIDATLAPRSRLCVWAIWAGFMVLTGIATDWLLELVSPLIPAGDWHWLISASFVVLVWPALMWSMRPLLKRHLPV